MDRSQEFHKIKETIAVIPYGHVATVKEMADGLEVSEDTILWALKEVDDDMIPIHRVVRDDGTLLGDSYSMNEETQKTALQKEAVNFVDTTTVDLENHFWSTCEYVRQNA